MGSVIYFESAVFAKKLQYLLPCGFSYKYLKTGGKRMRVRRTGT